MHKKGIKDSLFVNFRSTCSQACQKGVLVYEAAAAAGQAGVDRQEHPLPGDGGGEEAGEEHHWRQADTETVTEANTGGARGSEYT